MDSNTACSLTVFPLFLLSPQYIRLHISKPEAEPVIGFSLLPRQRSKTVLQLVLSLDPLCFCGNWRWVLKLLEELRTLTWHPFPLLVMTAMTFDQEHTESLIQPPTDVHYCFYCFYCYTKNACVLCSICSILELWYTHIHFLSFTTLGGLK